MNSYFFLNLSLVLYIVSFLLYSAFLYYKKAHIAKSATGLLIFTASLHAIALVFKTLEAGHAPFVNMYESIVFFTWAIILIYIYIEFKYKVREIGSIVLLIVVLGLFYSKTILSESEPLVPALQSIWLEIHVVTSFIGYAGFAIAYGIGLIYLLIKRKDNIISNFSIFNISFLGSLIFTFAIGILLKFIEEIYNIHIYPAYSAVGEAINEKIFGFTLSHIVLLATFIVSFILIFVFGFIKKEKNKENFIFLFAELNITFIITTLVYYVILAILNYFKNLSNLNLLILKTSICSIMFLSNIIVLNKKRQIIEKYFPDENVLDTIMFIAIAFGFPFLTSGIITGAIWANSAWGTYWGWDPKETWSLITWFIYATYLHARYAKGWRDTKAAYLAIYGFIAVVFTYFGVNLFFAGLHSYA